MTTMTQTNVQVYQVFIKATPEQIWEAITKPEFTAKYFHGSLVDSTFEPGAPTTAGRPTARSCGSTASSRRPTRRASSSHTWRALYDPETADEEPSRVTWEIEPGDGGVSKLIVVHDRLEGAPKTAASVSGAGWMHGPQRPEDAAGDGRAALRLGVRSASRVRPRGTISTGHAACCAHWWLTDPSSSPRKPPRPREPTTSRSAPAASPVRTLTAWPSITTASISTPAPRSRSAAAAASTAWSARARRSSPSRAADEGAADDPTSGAAHATRRRCAASRRASAPPRARRPAPPRRPASRRTRRRRGVVLHEMSLPANARLRTRRHSRARMSTWRFFPDRGTLAAAPDMRGRGTHTHAGWRGRGPTWETWFPPLSERAGSAGRKAHAPGKIRTCDLCLRRAALYPLSYGRGGGQV